MLPDPHDDAAPARLSAKTTPTWEMELLVSGATVFSLVQLPGVADRVLFGLYNTAAPDVAALVMPLWVYVKFVLLVLIATFIAHLCLRGYWVALAGLSTVYPDGIRWDRAGRRMGPLFLEQTRRQMGDMPTVIERADNRASRVFGVGFGLAAMMLLPMVLVAGLLAVMWVYAMLGGAHPYAMFVSMGVFLTLTMAFALVVTWDRWRGATARPDGPEGRALRAMMRAYVALGFSRVNNPLLALFSSNETSRGSSAVVAVAMVVMFAIVAVQGVADRLGWSMGDYPGLPPDLRATADTVLPEHYASQRGDTPRLRPAPYIDAPVVRGAYLRLFVPYFPQRHNPALKLTCPQALADTGDTGPRARLDCLAAMHAVALDGKALAIRFDAAEEPRTGQRGMLAMIPVAGLDSGRHELTVLPPPRERDLRPDAEPLQPYRIPFWR